MIRPAIIIPTCDRSPSILDRAVRSALAQELPAEVVVVDDGLTPVAQVWPGIRIVNLNNRSGPCVARNIGAIACSPETNAVCYLDDDDELMPSHTRLLAAALEAGAGFAFSRALYRFPDHETEDPEPNNPGPKRYYDPHALLVQNIAPISSFMHLRKAGDDIGWWDDGTARLEDWDFWGRLYIRYGPPAKVDAVTNIIHKDAGPNRTDSNQYNYSLMCSWRDVVDARLKHMAAEKRCRITEDDRRRFHVPRIGIPMAALAWNEPLRALLDSIIKQDADFEVLLTLGSAPSAGLDPRIRIFMQQSPLRDMMNWSLLVSRSEHLAFVNSPLAAGVLRQKSAFLDANRQVGVLDLEPVVMRRRVIETIGGLTSDLPDLIRRASERFEVLGCP